MPLACKCAFLTNRVIRAFYLGGCAQRPNGAMTQNDHTGVVPQTLGRTWRLLDLQSTSLAADISARRLRETQSYQLETSFFTGEALAACCAFRPATICANWS